MLDASRFVILRKYGGLYVDMDIEAFRPIESLLVNRSLFISDKLADPALMGSIPDMERRFAACTSIDQFNS